MKVLSVVGKGRSGSTLLDTALGQLPGFVSTGELSRLWEWGLRHGRLCGCGEPVPRCPTWTRALAAWNGGSGADTARWAESVVELQREVLAWRNVPRLLRAPRTGPTGWPPLEEYREVLSEVYRGIAAATGARVVVDSTKWPAAPTPLGLVPGTDVRVVHLVRDPRGVVHSWRRRKAWGDREEGEEMPRYGPLYSTASWWARNLVAEAVRRRLPPERSLLLRYEDFVADPAGALAGVARLAEEPAGDLGFLQGRRLRLAPTHTVGGNPVRLCSGAVELREDDAWRAGSSLGDRLVVTGLTLPLLVRYGYPPSPS